MGRFDRRSPLPAFGSDGSHCEHVLPGSFGRLLPLFLMQTRSPCNRLHLKLTRQRRLKWAMRSWRVNGTRRPSKRTRKHLKTMPPSGTSSASPTS